MDIQLNQIVFTKGEECYEVIALDTKKESRDLTLVKIKLLAVVWNNSRGDQPNWLICSDSIILSNSKRPYWGIQGDRTNKNQKLDLSPDLVILDSPEDAISYLLAKNL